MLNIGTLATNDGLKTIGNKILEVSNNKIEIGKIICAISVDFFFKSAKVPEPSASIGTKLLLKLVTRAMTNGNSRAPKRYWAKISGLSSAKAHTNPLTKTAENCVKKKYPTIGSVKRTNPESIFLSKEKYFKSKICNTTYKKRNTEYKNKKIKLHPNAEIP